MNHELCIGLLIGWLARGCQMPQNERMAMIYFTPELYERFNSLDDEIANQANDEWDQNLEKYANFQEDWKSQLSKNVREFQNLILHDAEVLEWKSVGENVILIACQENGNVYEIIYLDAKLKTIKHENKVFSWEQCLWLYDELSFGDKAEYIHNILLSNGKELHIEFEDIEVRLLVG